MPMFWVIKDVQGLCVLFWAVCEDYEREDTVGVPVPSAGSNK